MDDGTDHCITGVTDGASQDILARRTLIHHSVSLSLDILHEFSGPGENCQRNVTDLTGSPVTSSRPPGRLQKRPDDQTSNAGVAARTADGSWRTADACDEQCLRCRCSSPSCTVLPCAADIDGPLHTACTAPADRRGTSTCTVSSVGGIGIRVIRAGPLCPRQDEGQECCQWSTNWPPT